MSAFLLIRHASHDFPAGSLPGRLPGVGISAKGRAQADALASQLGKLPLDAVYSSPRERARQTAAPLAAKLGFDVLVDDLFDEIDYGEWTGKSFKDLDALTHWKQFNSFRSGTQIPGGEMFLDVQRRMVAGIQKLRQDYPDGTVAIFSHGDPIRTAIAFFAGMPLDHILRLQVGRGSVNAISVTETGARLLCVNVLPEGASAALAEEHP